jgi:hypothetical protein
VWSCLVLPFEQLQHFVLPVPYGAHRRAVEVCHLGDGDCEEQFSKHPVMRIEPREHALFLGLAQTRVLPLASRASRAFRGSTGSWACGEASSMSLTQGVSSECDASSWASESRRSETGYPFNEAQFAAARWTLHDNGRVVAVAGFLQCSRVALPLV